MFAKHSRPSRVRRFLHPLERSLGLENEIPGAEVVDALHRWALGLPWVLELSRPPGDDAGRRYAIDCPPLECRSVWLWVGPIEGSDSVFELNVVLPHDLAHRGAAIGWAVPIAELDGDRCVVEVAMPVCPAEHRALQALLQVAYDAAFRTAGAEATS